MCRKTLTLRWEKQSHSSRINRTASTCQLGTNNLSDYLVQPVLCNQTQLNHAANTCAVAQKCSSCSYMMAGLLPGVAAATKHLLCSFLCRCLILTQKETLSLLHPVFSHVHSVFPFTHASPCLYHSLYTPPIHVSLLAICSPQCLFVILSPRH